MKYLSILLTEPTLVGFRLHLSAQFADLEIETLCPKSDTFVKQDLIMHFAKYKEQTLLVALVPANSRITISPHKMGLLADLILEKDLSINETIPSNLTLYQ